MLARVVGNQLGLARALWWSLRGRTDVGPDDVPLRYNGLDRALIVTITVVGVLETVVVHVLVSWPPLRWPLLVLSVYGLLSLLAWDQTTLRHPHLLRPGELVLRLAHTRTVRVPLGHLTSVRRQVRNEHRKTLEVDDGGLALSFMGGTTVELRFSPPAEVHADGRAHLVDRVSFAAHDPAGAVALLRAREASPER
ncbi:hypothetical protein [Blastococcus tunisiensis]|uniref:PH domain-containing protein n=1 Tax=Blastococcus tunisiensis TaxID=1798228 RepID=A0A1I1XMD7_9ACTN|nr:hypothetical protein [Blastococcus sp. DSM 46838]SFE08569.1 hypothetical protein SAMN05216574_102123 [Blastococcus sp. DSM 46838]